jgi:hypothetical protein
LEVSVNRAWLEFVQPERGPRAAGYIVEPDYPAAATAEVQNAAGAIARARRRGGGEVFEGRFPPGRRVFG